MSYIEDWETNGDEIEDFHDLSEVRQARTFTNQGYDKKKAILEINLAKTYQRNILDNDEQLVIPIFGKPGSGKSSLMLWIEYFFTGKIDFDTTCFSHQQWAEKATSEQQGQFIKYEEGRQTFVKRRAMSGNNKDGLDILSIFRAKNNVHFICFQDISDVEESLIYFHADGVLWTHKLFQKKGYISAYSPKTLKKEEVRDKLTDGELEPGEHSDFTTGFPDFKKSHPEKWNKYENRKHENLKRIRDKFVDD